MKHVKNKWENLRDSFRQKYSSVSKVHPEEGIWPFFEAMGFSKEQLILGNPHLQFDEFAAATTSSVDVSDIGSSRSSICEFELTTFDSPPTTTAIDPAASRSYWLRNLANNDNNDKDKYVQNYLSRQHNLDHQQRQEEQQQNIKKDESDDENDGESSGKFSGNNNNSKESGNCCEDAKFFTSLIPHVKKIPDNLKLLFRNEVQNMLQKYAYPNNMPRE